MDKWMKKYRKICLTFNMVAPAKDNLCTLEKQQFLIGSMLGVKQSGRPLKHADVMSLSWADVMSVGRNQISVSRKSTKK
jgi:hypothetical protein